MQGQAYQQAPMQGQVWQQQYPPLQGQANAQQFPPLQGQINGQQFAPLQGQFATQQNTPLQGQGQTTMIQGGTSGGEEAYGVLGAVVSQETGLIKSVFPESDLNRFGIHPGDRVAGVNGHRFDPSTYQAECRGVPGSVLNLAIVHDGILSEYPVKRTDSRALAGNGSYYRKWAKRTRTW
jgi:predicted metalloprotease with PDZ domain